LAIPLFQFIHAADLHLGCAFKGVHAVNETVAKTLREATYLAFDRIIALAIEKQVAFVLFAGDIYDRTENSLQPQLRFRDGLQKLHQAGIASCVVHGNHDPLDGKAQALQWPVSCHRFPVTSSPPHVIEVEGVPVAAITGISYSQREMPKSLLEFYGQPHASPSLPLYADPYKSLFKIGLLHTNCGGDLLHGNYAPCTLEQLKSLSFDYWALGHIHKPGVLHPERPVVAYAGTPQGLNPKETGEHGCYLVSVDTEKNATLEAIPTCEVLWQQLQLDAQEWESQEQAVSALEDIISQTTASSGQRNVLLRVEVVGRSALHSWLNQSGTKDDLLDRLRSLNPVSPFVWTDRLTVSTLPQIDLESRAESDDIIGEILRQSKTMTTRETLQEIDQLFGHTRAGRVLETPTEEQLSAWLQQAALMAAGGLMEGEEL